MSKLNSRSYKGFYIIPYEKKVFGVSRTLYRVEQFDTVLFRSKSLEKCIEFVDHFVDAF